MSLNKAQYQSLFTNAFGDDPQAFGIAVEDTEKGAIGTIGSHKLSLLVVKEKPIAWMLDGIELVDWDGVMIPKDPRRVANAETLRAKIS